MYGLSTIKIWCIKWFICNLDIFLLISPSDILSFNELTLKLKTIYQCHAKHIMMLLIKNNVSFEGLDIHYH
jgi:hypothetical protein